MNKNLLLFLFGLIILLHSCERDDICAESTPTTPNALIEFYDVSNPETLKSVPGLFIVGEGMLDSETVEGANGSSESAVSLPLRTDAGETVFRFYKNGELTDPNDTPTDSTDDVIAGDDVNMDIVTISYTTEEVYVSRACGFKTIFTNVSVSVTDDADNWVLTPQIVVENNTIDNENQAHISFRH